MDGWVRRVFTFGILATVLGGGCGSGSGSGSVSSTPAESGSLGTSSPGAGSEQGQPLGGFGEPVNAPPGRVSVTLTSGEFRRGEPITGLVANGLESAVYAEDAGSDCSIVVLERSEDGTWRPIEGCAVRRPPVTVAIGSSRGRVVTLVPGSDNFAAALGPQGVPLAAGTYRLTFAYRLDPASGAGTVVHSEPFDIVG